MGIPEPKQAKARTFDCKGCGAALKVRSPAQCKTLICDHCGSHYDLSGDTFALLGKYDIKTKHAALIPLGRRGTIDDVPWEVLGYMRRRIRVDNVPYEWSEYLLWNPYRGYRFLTEYAGHWTFVRTLPGVAATVAGVRRYGDLSFQLFQSADAEVSYVIGEFFWQVRMGEKGHVTDCISPPYVLSLETSGNEIVWSMGEYMEPQTLVEGFKLGSLPEPRGIGPAQPSPYAHQSKLMKRLFWGFMAAALVVQIYFWVMSSNAQAHQESFKYAATDTEKSRITKPFMLLGHTSSVKVDVVTDLSNNWAHFHLALINAETGDAHDLGKGVEYYSGVDDGEAWSEGDRKGSATIARVAPGQYYLRVEPETDAKAISYTVSVHRNVPQYWQFWVGLPIILIPYLWFLHRRRSFEYQRWLESDTPMTPLFSSGGSSDDE